VVKFVDFYAFQALTSILFSIRELTKGNLPELYHFPRIFKTQINAD